MSIWKPAICLVVLCVMLGRRGAAQGGNVDLEEKAPLVVSGFAVGLGSYDRNLAQSAALGSKIALSLFRPWSDQLYFFGQLTTHLEEADSGPRGTAIEIDNLIINWTPARLSTLSLSFGRFDAPIGFERDDEPLNLIPTTSFTFENARPVKFTGLIARYTLNPKVSVLGMIANGWDQVADNNSGKTAGFKLQVFPSSGLAVAGGAFYGPERDSTNGSPRTLLTGDATWQPLQRLIIQAEAHRGSEATTHWTGVVGQAFWRVGRSTGLTVRGAVKRDRISRARLPLLGETVLYDLRHSDLRVRWLVTLLLATLGTSYLFGAWMVALYAGFSPRKVAETYGPAGEAVMAMQMPPDTTVVAERSVSIAEMGEEMHHVDKDLLVQDTHVHMPMYAVIAACLSVIALGLALPRWAGLAIIAVLFAAPWLDFAGMWLTKLASPRFAIVTLAGGWAMALGYTIVAG